ncbi:MAG: response regulator transcription factor [Eubacterium sp.]|nr:response regulator transcription factor [Eubacterium sp.]
MPESRLLILCHEEDKCLELRSYFEESGYQVICCVEYDDALSILSKEKNKPEMVILETDRGGRAVYETIDRIRAMSEVAVILLSEDDRLETQLYAYSKKIDDYIVSPVPLPLLEAHVEAVLRRTGDHKLSIIRAGALSIDYESRKIYLADEILKVTAKEFDLMEYFVQHKGMILSRDKILDAVWGFDYVGGYRSVDTLVKKLRAKLTKDYPYIQTVYGVGYCFDV